MIHLRPLARGLAAVALLCPLVGCISLLPKEKPAQLYRFGVPATAGSVADTPGQFSVSRDPTNFERAANGDQILAITGDQAAYVAGARWVTAAGSLFDAAVANAFDADNGPARLIPRGAGIRSDYLLKLDVRTFEVRYDRGPKAPPTVVVEVYAGLIKRSDELTTTAPAERIFQASVPTSENRISAIAQAFDSAVTQVLGKVVAWVDAKGA